MQIRLASRSSAAIAQPRRPRHYVVASGWGPGAGWYRNICHNPDVTIRVGNRTLAMPAVLLSSDWHSVDGAEVDYRQSALHLPFVRFVYRTAD
ncbi:nitroreductase/quinone reductase family protein [Mycobacterium sp.]|uniref:nitroreductase/quinone reductase family protein n=1 Tax=Mycobacterium sp. TaxID=1785 RepID=UPI0039C8C28D